MSDKVKNILERSVKTFVEVGASTLAAGLSGVDIVVQGKDRTFWIGLGLSVLSAALSAVWNGVIQPLLTTQTTTEK